MNTKLKTKSIESKLIHKLSLDFQESGIQAIEGFWKNCQDKSAPLIEPDLEREDRSLVTFVYFSEEELQNLVIITALSGQNTAPKENLCDQLPGSSFYYRTFSVPNGTKTIYAFSKNNDLSGRRFFENVFGNWQGFFPDPNNSKRYLQKYSYFNKPFSLEYNILEVPPYHPPPWIHNDPSIPKGSVEKIVFPSRILKQDRVIWVYVPADYKKSEVKCNLSIIFDGKAFIQFSNIPRIMDKLIAGNYLPPTIAIFVHNYSGYKRGKDLACYPPFAEYVAKELLPYIESEYRCFTEPSKRVLTGSSSGALGAIFIAWKYPELFGKVLAQSPYLQWGIKLPWFQSVIKHFGNDFHSWWNKGDESETEWITAQFSKNERKPIEFYVNLGSLEVEYRQPYSRFVDILKEKGYKYKSEIYKGGHEYINWAEHFGTGLNYLIGLESRKDNLNEKK